MIRIKYNGQVAILENLSGFGFRGKEIGFFSGEATMSFMFETEDLTKSIFEKIFMTDKDLDIDAMLREDKETKRKK